MSEQSETIIKGALNEVTIPETEQDEEEELALYVRYREMGGMAIEEYERRIGNGAATTTEGSTQAPS